MQLNAKECRPPSGASRSRSAAWIAIAWLASPLLVGCPDVPGHDRYWLSYKYSECDSGKTDACFNQLTAATPAFSYYQGLGIADPDNYNLEMWLSDNGFSSGSPTARAVYGNLADLQFGRDMHCAQTGERIACYVSNFGLPLMELGEHGFVPNPLWPNITFAVNEAVRGSSTLGTVAMIYDPSKYPINDVSFYAFADVFIDPDGDGIGETRSNVLQYEVQLDQEFSKSVPRMCMACHGGTYNTSDNTVMGASFLPFDVFSFRFSDQAGFTFDEQQGELRKLNAFVVASHPAQPIVDLINGLYPGGVNNAGSTSVDGYVPSGWSDQSTLYTSVVRPYCRTCHVAQPLSFISYDQFEENATLLTREICDRHAMPHALVPYGVNHKSIGFWHDRIAQHDLREFFTSQQMTSCMPDDK